MRLIDADQLIKDMVSACSPTQFGRGTAKMMVKTAETVDPIRAAGGWISVRERLPKTWKRVLISDGEFVYESYLDQYGYWRRGSGDLLFMTPAYWAYLREPPKEEP